MRENRVRSWREVVGSVIRITYCSVQWKGEKNISRHLATCFQSNCQRTKSSWPCSIQKYCRVQRNSSRAAVAAGSPGQTNHEAMCKDGPTGSVKVNYAATQPAGKPLPLGRREEYSVRKPDPVSAINTDEEKSGKRRAEARGKIPPLYRIWRIPSAYSMFHHKFLARGG